MIVRNQDLFNQLYRLSLEFGRSWRRPIESIVQETAPDLNETEQAEISDYIRETRGKIEHYFYERYEDTDDKKIAELQRQGARWIQREFPWMDEETVSQGISQAIYYAWHG